MALTWKELRSLPMEELVSRYNDQAGTLTVSAELYFNELNRRTDELNRKAAEAQTAAMLHYNRGVRNLTWMLLLITVLMTLAAAVQVIAALPQIGVGWRWLFG